MYVAMQSFLCRNSLQRNTTINVLAFLKENTGPFFYPVPKMPCSRASQVQPATRLQQHPCTSTTVPLTLTLKTAQISHSNTKTGGNTMAQHKPALQLWNRGISTNSRKFQGVVLISEDIPILPHRVQKSHFKSLNYHEIHISKNLFQQKSHIQVSN